MPSLIRSRADARSARGLSSEIRERPLVRSCSKPHLRGHVRVQLDTVRQRFAVLGPERVYWPDEVAVDILKLCNGERTIVEIAAQLAEDYAAPVETIQTDVMEFVQSWTDIRLLRLSAE
jgi:pyrroloquinoline quinone biosynthesis protein D